MIENEIKGRLAMLVYRWQGGGGTVAGLREHARDYPEQMAGLLKSYGVDLTPEKLVTILDTVIEPTEDRPAPKYRSLQRARDLGMSAEEYKGLYREVYVELRAELQAEMAMVPIESAPIVARGPSVSQVVSRGRPMSAQEQLSYRDGLTRAQQAAATDQYKGLVELGLQAKTTGDALLERAVFDCARDLDAETGGAWEWAETLRYYLEEATPEDLRHLGVKSAAVPAEAEA